MSSKLPTLIHQIIRQELRTCLGTLHAYQILPCIAGHISRYCCRRTDDNVVHLAIRFSIRVICGQSLHDAHCFALCFLNTWRSLQPVSFTIQPCSRSVDIVTLKRAARAAAGAQVALPQDVGNPPFFEVTIIDIHIWDTNLSPWSTREPQNSAYHTICMIITPANQQLLCLGNSKLVQPPGCATMSMLLAGTSVIFLVILSCVADLILGRESMKTFTDAFVNWATGELGLNCSNPFADPSHKF